MADTEILIIFIAVFCVAIGALVGRMLDTAFRGKTLRSMLKKNYGYLCIVSKDNKNIRPILVNFEKDVFMLGDKQWAATKGRIYRMDKEEKGFFVSDNNIRWQEGLPCIYVDEDSLKPLDFWQDAGLVKPGEVGSLLTAWTTNQIAKGLLGMQKKEWIIYIVIILALIAAVLSYQTMTIAGATDAKVTAIEQRLANATVVNSTGGVISVPTPTPTR
mgnify:CR=1 FL=1